MKESNYDKRQVQSNKRLALWTVLWMISMALATFGPQFWWEPDGAATWIALAANAALGIQLILANIIYLRGLDDMQRQIHLESMAIALGVAVVGGLFYALLDINKLVPGGVQIGFLVIAIGLSYLIALVIAQKRYQ